MEKKLIVLTSSQLFQWQIDALENLKKNGFVIFTIFFKQEQINFSKRFKILKYLETKILKSSTYSLKIKANPFNSDNVGTRFENTSAFLKAFKRPSDKIYSVISFLQLDEGSLHDLSSFFGTEVLQIEAEGYPSEHSLIKAMMQNYVQSKMVVSINICKYFNERKEVVYRTWCSLESGLLLRSMNAALVKCSLLLSRYMNGQCVSNAVIDEYIAQPMFEKHSYLRSFARHLWQKVYYKRQWHLLYNVNSDTEVNHINQFKKLLPPKNKIWADPFVVNHENQSFIFLEEMDTKANKGYISYCSVVDGKISRPKKVIETDYHLSFPFIFDYNGKRYMIPETYNAGNIQLWECIRFPENWELKSILIDNIKAVDTVLQEMNGKWWLFCTVKSLPQASGHEELFLYYADDPLSSKWTPHQKNPVISDARLGRNAGKIECKDGVYYRYAQFSGYAYGKAITKSEIVHISETSYQERILEIVYPDKKYNHEHLHTFNFAGDIVVGDALRNVKRFF